MIELDGKWIEFSSLHQMEEYFKKNKFGVDYPDYPEQFSPGWYYVYNEGRYFRRGATDYYLCFVKAEDRIKQVQDAMKELANELSNARQYKNESVKVKA